MLRDALVNRTADRSLRSRRGLKRIYADLIAARLQYLTVPSQSACSVYYLNPEAENDNVVDLLEVSSPLFDGEVQSPELVFHWRFVNLREE